MKGMRLRRMGAMAAVGLGLLVGPSSVSASTSPTLQRTELSGWDRVSVAVNAGRVWAGFQRGFAPQVRVRSRTLSGRSLREWTVDVPRTLDGVPGVEAVGGDYRDLATKAFFRPSLTGVVVAGRRVYLSSRWCVPPDAGGRCDGQAVTSYALNGSDGRQVGGRGEVLISGDQPLVRGPLSDAGTPVTVRNLVTGSSYAVPYPAGVRDGGFATDGSWLQQSWSAPNDDESSVLRMVALRTGEVAWTRTTRELLRIVRVDPRRNTLFGSAPAGGRMGVGAERQSGRGIWPAVVQSNGSIRRIGRTLRGATAVEVLPAAGSRRLVVSVGGYTKTKTGRRSCSGLWVIDDYGRRGARLKDVPRGWTVSQLLSGASWDGAILAAKNVVHDSSGDNDRAVAIWRGLDTLRLSASDLPKCIRGRR